MRRNGQALAYARALVDLLVLARGKGDSLNDFLHVFRDVQLVTIALASTLLAS